MRKLSTIPLFFFAIAVGAAPALGQPSPDAAVNAVKLMAQERVPEALQIVRDIVAGDPSRIEHTFEALNNSWGHLRSDRTRDYSAMTRDIDGLARRQLTTLPREAAARAAYWLIRFEYEAGIREYEAGLTAFIDEYGGTGAALEAEVDILARRVNRTSMRAWLDTFDRFAAEHPGTSAAAKAIYYKASNLSANAIGTDVEARGADPTPRLLSVIAIVNDMEARFPTSPWTAKAVDTVTTFSTFNQQFGPATAATALAAYREFVLTHFPSSSDGPVDSRLDYLITSRYGDLVALNGDRLAGIEALLTDLARDPQRASRAQFLKAQLYLSSRQSGGADRDGLLRRAESVLQELQKNGDVKFGSALLNRLASVYFREADDTRARESFRAYLQAYPQTEFASTAALRLGQVYEAMGDRESAVTTYRDASSRFAAQPVTRVLGALYAARVLDSLGRFGEARIEYGRALEGWDDEKGFWEYRLRVERPLRAGDSLLVTSEDTSKPELEKRLATLAASLSAPGGSQLEQGRWLLQAGRPADALAPFQEVAGQFPQSPNGVEARRLLHRAMLETTLNRLVEKPGTEAAAMRELDALLSEPFDVYVFEGKVARACLLLGQNQAEAAERELGAALKEWQARNAPIPRARSPLEEDVRQIREVVFRPLGGGVFGSNGWNAFSWPQTLPPFLILTSEISVKTVEVPLQLVAARQTFPQADSVLFLAPEEMEFFSLIMNRIGGTLTRAPRAIMETPNQPIGRSLDILAFWNKFFPARPGHWGGWEFYSYPAFFSMEFLDAERTRAAVPVSIGYSGATVLLEKVDGVWRAVRLVNQWIT